MYHPLHVWTQGEPVRTDWLNEAVEALGKLNFIFGADGIDTFQTLGGTTLTPQQTPSGSHIFRMQVTTPDVGTNVVLAKLYDGTDQSGGDIAVRVFFQKQEDDEIFAFVPVGGTDAIYGGDPVEWQEVFQLGRGQYQGMVVSATTQNQVGWDFVRATTLPE